MDIKFMAEKLMAGFIIILVYIKLSGRKQLAPLSPTDQIGNMVMGALVSSAIVSSDVSILESVVLVFMWGFLQLFLRYFKFKSNWFTELLDGKKYQLMKDGKLREEDLKKAQISILDFENNIHSQGVKSLSQINNAWFDSSGNISLDLKTEKNQSNLLIYNGQYNTESLERLGLEETYLTQLLEEENLKLEEVLCLEWFNEKFYLFSDGTYRKIDIKKAG